MRFRSLTVPTIVILAFVAAPPAFAAPDADTVVTFTVAATDGLNITAPATATLATGADTGDHDQRSARHRRGER